MTIEEASVYYNILTDAWRLFRKYIDVSGSNSYWESLKNDSEAIAEKYNYSEFVRKIIVSVNIELERIYNQRECVKSSSE